MTKEEMLNEYEVLGFAYGYVLVKRLSDGVRGTLEFDHSPRIYRNFQEE